MTWSNLRFSVSRSFVAMTTNLPSCFLIQFLEQLLEFLLNFTSLKYSNIPHIRNSIFHLRPKEVSYNTRLSGNKCQCFLYEGCKLIAFHMSLQCLITQGK